MAQNRATFDNNFLSLIGYSLGFIILFCSLVSAEQNSAIAAIDSMLASKEAGYRAWAAKRLSRPDGYDSTTAIYRLLDALRNEIEHPLSTSKIDHGMTTVTEDLRYQYCRSLASLAPVSTSIIYPLIDSANGEFRSRLILVLAYCGDNRSHKDVVDIYKNDRNPFLRLAAIRAFRNVPDSSDISILKSALSDTFWVSEFIDSETGAPINVFYPIRAEAAAILFKRGIDSIRRGWDYEVIENKK